MPTGGATQNLPGVNLPAATDTDKLAVVDSTGRNITYLTAAEIPGGDVSAPALALEVAPFLTSDSIRAETVTKKLEVLKHNPRNFVIEERFLGEDMGVLLGGAGVTTSIVHDDSDHVTGKAFTTDGTNILRWSLSDPDGSGASLGLPQVQDAWSAEFLVHVVPGSRCQMTFGTSIDLNFGTGVSGIRFIYDNPAGGTVNWRVQQNSGGTVDTGVQVSETGPQLLRLQGGGQGGLEADRWFIDGVQVHQAAGDDGKRNIGFRVQELTDVPGFPPTAILSCFMLRYDAQSLYNSLPDVELLP